MGNYEKELGTALELARAAGESILRYYERGEIIAESKLGADNYAEPVTAADREASRIIVEGLRDAFPDDAVLSEEEIDDADHRLARERVWIVDPIDGTAGFIKRDGDFAVQVGFADAGVPVAGVVLLPFHGVTYFASKGDGAFAQHVENSPTPIETSDNYEFREMNLAVSRNHRSPKMSRIMDEIGFRHEIQRGSVGLKIGLIADRVCDMYIHLSPRTKLWDTCAPQIILEEAGGRLTDLWGATYRYDVRDVQNWGGIVASNGVRHDEVIERLRPMLNEFGRHKVMSRQARNG